MQVLQHLLRAGVLLLGHAAEARPDLHLALVGHLEQGDLVGALDDMVRVAAAQAPDQPDRAAELLGVFNAANALVEISLQRLAGERYLADLPSRLGAAYDAVTRWLQSSAQAPALCRLAHSRRHGYHDGSFTAGCGSKAAIEQVGTRWLNTRLPSPSVEPAYRRELPGRIILTVALFVSGGCIAMIIQTWIA
jgi:hypothetical protein